MLEGEVMNIQRVKYIVPLIIAVLIGTFTSFLSVHTLTDFGISMGIIAFSGPFSLFDKSISFEIFLVFIIFNVWLDERSD